MDCIFLRIASIVSDSSQGLYGTKNRVAATKAVLSVRSSVLVYHGWSRDLWAGQLVLGVMRQAVFVCV